MLVRKPDECGSRCKHHIQAIGQRLLQSNRSAWPVWLSDWSEGTTSHTVLKRVKCNFRGGFYKMFIIIKSVKSLHQWCGKRHSLHEKCPICIRIMNVYRRIRRCPCYQEKATYEYLRNCQPTQGWPGQDVRFTSSCQAIKNLDSKRCRRFNHNRFQLKPPRRHHSTENQKDSKNKYAQKSSVESEPEIDSGIRLRSRNTIKRSNR